MKFSDIFWIMDDIAAINDNGKFDKVYHEIYPTELEMRYKGIFSGFNIKIANQFLYLRPQGVISIPHCKNAIHI